MQKISRWVSARLLKGLSFQRAALVVGARQSGKTTLVRDLCPIESNYTTLDDLATLSAAQSDPHFFLRQAKNRCLIIDEVQKAPELIPEVKRYVDTNDRPGQFILTGSADYRKLPSGRQADSLAGRVVVFRLQTLTQGEVCGKEPSFLRNAFDLNFPGIEQLQPCCREEVYKLAICGGYPQTIGFDEEERSLYFDSYIQSQLSYDLSKQWDLRRYKDLKSLMQMFAAYSSKPMNIQEICRRVQGNALTISSYIQAFETMYLLDELPAWESKDFKIGSKTPELFLTDSALMAHLLGIHRPEDLLSSYEKMANEGGKLVETWAYTQLIAEVELNPMWTMYHFRNKNKQEIDFLIVDEKNRILGVEIKAAETINSEDFKHLRWFSSQVEDFRGIVLYAGKNVLSFGSGLYAVPFSAMWSENIS